MKKIILHSITLTNWRGEKSRTTKFNTDAATYIKGSNGLGKSRHFDAFCWLLFGKDSHDRKDYELRTYDENHQPLHHCECSVSAVISIDGQPHTLRREYQEQWVKPRGQVEEVFKGNITTCTWDGVPVKVSDFQKRIAANIIDETIFKMITNPRYFLEKMKWQLQRETLLQIAGTKSDAELATGNPDFKALLDQLDGKSLADFRKQLSLEKKRLKAELDDIEPRIDQTQKMMPEAEDWKALQHEEDEAQAQLVKVQQQLDNSAKMGQAQQQKAHDLVADIAALKAQQADLYYNYKEKLEKEATKKNDARKQIEKQCHDTAAENTDNNIDIRHTEDRIAYLQEQTQSLTAQLEELRKEWYEISSKQYDGSDTCPHCGQRLPEDMIASAKEDFEQHKLKLITMNTERGKSLSAQLKSYESELAEKQTELKTLHAREKSINDKMQELYDQLAAHPAAKVADIKETDVPGYADLQKQIDALNAEVEKLTKPAATDDDYRNTLLEQRQNIQNTIFELQGRLLKQEQIAKGEKEIEKLSERGKDLAQQIAEIEKREYTAAQFSKKKIEDCEQRINGMFSTVRFQLFDYTQDGNEFETCIPLVGGVPYSVANTASQINAGLDVINTLCRFYNVSAPIFCDGAESVNRYIETASQMIFLQVTTDKQLVVK